MVNEFDKRRLRFLVAPTRSDDPALKEDLEKGYTCWKQVWGTAFSEEMNVQGPLYSDYYSKQMYVGILFLGHDPVGLITLNPFELSSQIDLDDSFWKVWPQDAFSSLKKNNARVFSCTNVTLNFRYRNNFLGVSGKDLLLAMMVRYLMLTDFDGIVSCVRLEKSMEKVAYRLGASSLAVNLPYTIPGQFVDIVYWNRNVDLSKWDPHIKELTDYVFKNAFLRKGESYAA